MTFFKWTHDRASFGALSFTTTECGLCDKQLHALYYPNMAPGLLAERYRSKQWDVMTGTKRPHKEQEYSVALNRIYKVWRFSSADEISPLKESRAVWVAALDELRAYASPENWNNGKPKRPLSRQLAQNLGTDLWKGTESLYHRRDRKWSSASWKSHCPHFDRGSKFGLPKEVR